MHENNSKSFILTLKFKSFNDRYLMFLDFLYCKNNISLSMLRIFKGNVKCSLDFYQTVIFPKI